MRGPGHDPGRAARDSERELRVDQMAHRRASDAAGRVAALTLLVVVYAGLVAIIVAISWADMILGDTASWSAVRWRWVHIVHGGAISALALTGGVAGYGAYRAGRGSFAQGQGVQVSLLLGAVGAAGVGLVAGGFGVAVDVANLRWFPWACPCVCTGLAPFLVAGMNLLVLLRYGNALRQDERFVEGV